MELDWGAVERDYLNGTMSYQKLAEKYGISCAQVRKRGREGRWAEKRRQTQTSGKESRKERVQNLADQLLGMLELAVQETDRQLHLNLDALRAGKTEAPSAKSKGNSLLDMGEIKQMTAALKEILLLQNEDETEENTVFSVILEGDVEKYAR